MDSPWRMICVTREAQRAEQSTNQCAGAQSAAAGVLLPNTFKVSCGGDLDNGRRRSSLLVEIIKNISYITSSHHNSML